MNPELRIALGCDEAALELKNTLYAFLKERGVAVTDFGVFSEAPSLYPDMAAAVALSIVRPGVRTRRDGGQPMPAPPRRHLTAVMPNA